MEDLSANEDKVEKAKIFLELALKSDETIREANKRLTEKVNRIFTVASALIPIVFGLGYFIIEEKELIGFYCRFFLV